MAVPSSRAPLLCAALLFAVPTEGFWGTTALEETSDDCKGEHGLRGWLCLLSFDVPDQHLDVGSGLTAYHIDIIGLRCYNLVLGQVTSSLQPSPTDPTYHLGLAGISIQCETSQFDFRQVDWPHLSGTGKAAVTVGGFLALGSIAWTVLMTVGCLVLIDVYININVDY